MFTNLWVRSNYTLLSSALSIDDIINHAVNNNFSHASLIDTNLFGALEFYDKCIKKNIKPIIGVEIFLNKEKVIIIAKNYKGYKNMILLYSLMQQNKKININEYSDLLVLRTCENFLKCCIFEQGKETILKTLYAIKKSTLLKNIYLTKNELNSFLLNKDNYTQFYTPEQLKKIEEIIKSIDLTIENEELDFVSITPEPKKKILEECLIGLKKRLKTTTYPKSYSERLIQELDVIKKLNFCDYFLVVADYINWAKNNNITVGIGRGSAVGSLVSYVLGISDIDPIKHNLIFERFMNLYRKGCPDIDVDIMDSRRKEVINYLIDKYGIDNTCGIVAFHRIKIKQAIRDVGKILNYSDNVINLLCHSIPKEIEDNFATTFLNHDALRKNYESYKELFDLAINIINFPKTVSIHPAGIVLTKKKIYEHVPIYKLNDNEYVTQYTNDYLERFGVVKVDLLSLNTLTKIQTNLDTINKNHNITLTFETIPKIDRKTFAMLSKGENSNLFQMESYQMKKMLKEIKPQSIEDISIISALGRPGTQDLIPEYIKNRNNPNKIIYLSNATKDILKSTSNIMVYEEQLMQIVRSICNWSWAETDNFRRAIKKKDKKILAAIKNDFIAAGLKNNYQNDDVEKIFTWIEKFASYGFNHAHSIAYAHLIYIDAYIKANYPLEFYLNMLLANEGTISQNKMINMELKKLSFNMLPPNIFISSAHYKIYNNQILFGFCSINSINDETGERIEEAMKNFAEEKNFINVIGHLAINKISKQTCEILIKSCCFDSLGMNKTEMIFNLDEVYEKTKIIINGKRMFLPKIINKEKDENFEKQWINEYLGIDFYEDFFINIRTKNPTFLPLSASSKSWGVAHSYAKIIAIKIITKNDKEFAAITVEDDTKLIDCFCFEENWKNIKSIAEENKYFVISIKQSDKGNLLLNLKNL